MRTVERLTAECEFGWHQYVDKNGAFHGCTGACRGNDRAQAIGNFAGEQIRIQCTCQCHEADAVQSDQSVPNPVSIDVDHHFYVPVGMRDSLTRLFSEFEYYTLGELANAGHPPTDHQVFLAHGACGNSMSLTDEQFYFEDAEDARWFYREGYKRMLYGDEERPDRMQLWIDGKIE